MAAASGGHDNARPVRHDIDDEVVVERVRVPAEPGGGDVDGVLPKLRQVRSDNIADSPDRFMREEVNRRLGPAGDGHALLSTSAIDFPWVVYLVPR